MRLFDRGEERALALLALPSALCVLLYISRVVDTHSWQYWFLIENLALAWLPLIFAWLLVKNLAHRPWISLPGIGLSILWLLFLPNAWYVLTDYVHAVPTGQISQLFDVVLITSLVLAGFATGFTSLLMVHRQLLKRLRQSTAWVLVALILLLSSFAIYLGRDLRWSSWDVVSDPTGITLDVSDRVVHPLGHPKSWDMTGSVFLLLAVIYSGLWIVTEEFDLVPKRGRG